MDGIPQMAPGMGNAGAASGGQPPIGGMPPGMDDGADFGDEDMDASGEAGGDPGLAAL